MQDFAFYNAGLGAAESRAAAPLRRLFRRLLRPVFFRQAELLRGLNTQVETLAQRIERAQIRLFLAENEHCYLGVGGLGDALLTIAVAHFDAKARVLFAANPQIQSVVAKFFAAFDLPCCIVDFPKDKKGFWDLVATHPHCRSVGALPDNLDWDYEWVHHLERYLPRLVTRMPLRERFGIRPNPCSTRGIVGLAPRSAWIGTYKRKDLSPDEYARLVNKYLDLDFTVFGFGSRSDLEHYGLYPHDHVFWFSTDFMATREQEMPLETPGLFAALNACDEVISVDTWVKTYSALAGIPTKVILSRHHTDNMHIYLNDSGDRIFLNPAVWKIQLVGFSDLGI
jgi:hypothetical protein